MKGLLLILLAVSSFFSTVKPVSYQDLAVIGDSLELAANLMLLVPALKISKQAINNAQCELLSASVNVQEPLLFSSKKNKIRRLKALRFFLIFGLLGNAIIDGLKIWSRFN